LQQHTNISNYGYTGTSPFRACPDFSSGGSGVGVVAGNVLTVFSDKKHTLSNNHTTPYIVSTTDYDPFGMIMNGRDWNPGEYRFAFNGKEKDDEVYGTGNWQDYGMRMYNPRIGRFPNPDPIIIKEHKYPELSTYQFASNTPIQSIDQDGLEMVPHYFQYSTNYGETSLKVVNDAYNKLPTDVRRGINASANMTFGTFAAVGGLGLAVVTWPTGVGEMVGGTVASFGAYKFIAGARQLVNVMSGGDKQEDPKYVTPIGDMTDSKTVDDIADLVAGAKIYNPNKAASTINTISTTMSVKNVIEDVYNNVKSNTQKSTQTEKKTELSQKTRTKTRKEVVDRSSRLTKNVKNSY